MSTYAEACAVYERSRSNNVVLQLADDGGYEVAPHDLKWEPFHVRAAFSRGMLRERYEIVARRWQLHMHWRHL